MGVKYRLKLYANLLRNIEHNSGISELRLTRLAGDDWLSFRNFITKSPPLVEETVRKTGRSYTMTQNGLSKLLELEEKLLAVKVSYYAGIAALSSVLISMCFFLVGNLSKVFGFWRLFNGFFALMVFAVGLGIFGASFWGLYKLNQSN